MMFFCSSDADAWRFFVFFCLFIYLVYQWRKHKKHEKLFVKSISENDIETAFRLIPEELKGIIQGVLILDWKKQIPIPHFLFTKSPLLDMQNILGALRLSEIGIDISKELERLIEEASNVSNVTKKSNEEYIFEICLEFNQLLGSIIPDYWNHVREAVKKGKKLIDSQTHFWRKQYEPDLRYFCAGF